MDSRRRFTEARAGGCECRRHRRGLPRVKCSILNRRAEKLIGQIETEALGRPAQRGCAELVELFTNARDGTTASCSGTGHDSTAMVATETCRCE